MSQQKLKIYKLRLSLVLLIALITVPSVAVLSLFFSAPVSAASTDCSDVFTPLSTYVTDGVSRNRTFYVQAMNETGVPWEMLAAIHFRETNFSHNNPSNGQGIFQFVSGDGGPYPAGPVSDSEFYRQLKFMANRIQSDYVFRNSPNAAAVQTRRLTGNEQDINLIKNTLFSYNGRSTQYANQAAQYGYSSATQPYEGSPYVMNRFDCPRARMGIITQDYGTIDSTDTRYGTFTVFARLRGNDYWLAMTKAYSWVLNSQQLYYDSTRINPADSSMLAANTTYYVRVSARNIGSSTWTNAGTNPVEIGTSNPQNRNSAFCDTSTWVSCSRAAVLKEASVAPGEIGTFEFPIKTPSYGSYREDFNLLAEGKSWMTDIGMYLPLTVRPPTYNWTVSSQEAYVDSTRSKPLNTNALARNTRYYFRVRALNNGNAIWTSTGSNPVEIGTSNLQNRNSAFCDDSWIACSRVATLKEASVAPGQVGTFEFSIKTPGSYGSYREYFNLVSENNQWMRDVGMYLPLTVIPPTPIWSLLDQKLYTDSSASTLANKDSVANGSRVYAKITALNTGNTTWTNDGTNPVRLGTSSPENRTSIFKDSTWDSANRAGKLKEATVGPGEVGTFEFWMHAPYQLDGFIYKEYFKPLVEGSTWMNDIGLYFGMTAQTPASLWSLNEQTAFSDPAMSRSVSTTALQTSTTYYLRLTMRNTGGRIWTKDTLRLGTSNPQNRNSAFCDTSTWVSCSRAAVLKEASVAPGEIGTFEFPIKTPSTPVNTNEYFQPVVEGVTWLQDIGLYWPISTN